MSCGGTLENCTTQQGGFSAQTHSQQQYILHRIPVRGGGGGGGEAGRHRMWFIIPLRRSSDTSLSFTFRALLIHPEILVFLFIIVHFLIFHLLHVRNIIHPATRPWWILWGSPAVISHRLLWTLWNLYSREPSGESLQKLQRHVWKQLCSLWMWISYNKWEIEWAAILQ